MDVAPLASPLEAEDAFYRAFERGDVDAMMALWATDDLIQCIHPMGRLLVGASAIRASWLDIFAVQVPRRFEIESLGRSGYDDIAIHLVHETIVLPLQRQRFPPLIATNVYRRGPAGWRMILHHASPVGNAEPPAVPVAPVSSRTRH